MKRAAYSWAVGVVATMPIFAACQNYHHQLQRGQGYYERNQYEMALAVWRNLEDDQSSLDSRDLVRYCYLRGMTDFRLGYRDDARYWLGLSKATQKAVPGALQEDEAARLDRTLGELNREAYGDDAPGEVAQDLGDACRWTSDCEDGFMCKERVCVVIEHPHPVELPQKTPSEESPGEPPEAPSP